MVAIEPAQQTASQTSASQATQEIRDYWDSHVHDLAVAKSPVGTRGFFDELDEYRFDKLRYLPRVVDFNGFRGKRLLEVGCGAGIDLARFAGGGANVTGIDLAPTSIALAQKNFEQRGLSGELLVMDGEHMTFPDNSFDVVYGHGVLQYAADPAQIVREINRVLRPGGTAILQVYNRHSWLRLMSRVAKVDLEHEDAPRLRTYSLSEFRELLDPLDNVRMFTERFPVPSRLHGGAKGFLYNVGFVRTFNLLPRRLVSRFGWHIMAFATKGA